MQIFIPAKGYGEEQIKDCSFKHKFEIFKKKLMRSGILLKHHQLLQIVI